MVLYRSGEYIRQSCIYAPHMGVLRTDSYEEMNMAAIHRPQKSTNLLGALRGSLPQPLPDMARAPTHASKTHLALGGIADSECVGQVPLHKELDLRTPKQNTIKLKAKN